MDLSHSGWSDIFFLGMDFPEGARVLNISIDLSVRSRGAPKPPVEAWFRVIDQPVLRLVSVDLQSSAELSSIAEVFDFAHDYLGLLKAAVIASGIVPAGDGGRHSASHRRPDPFDGPGRPRHRNRQQGERYSPRLAPGGVHQPSGLPHFLVHARHQPDPHAHRRPLRRRPPPGGRARHSGRMAGGLGRRLAGFRRRVAGNQADSRGSRPRRAIRNSASAAADCCPTTRFLAPRRCRRKRASSFSRAWCWSTAAWRRMSVPFWRW